MAAAVVVTVAAGCGAGAGPSTPNVAVSVTRDFGTRSVAQIQASHPPASLTITGLLQDHLRIGTKYSGDFIESIDGFSGTASHRDWFYYVDGIEAPMGAGTTQVHAGDRIWWDLHDWSATDSIPAVVGSYPEPFTRTAASRRSTTLECMPETSTACSTVASALSRVGVTVRRRDTSSTTSTRAPSILVGTFAALAADAVTRLVGAGPEASGVYVRATAHDRTLQLLDPAGRSVESLGTGTGLVAATVVTGSTQPTWLVTGTDPTGVLAAARALTPADLHDVFALVVSGGRRLPVPRDPAS